MRVFLHLVADGTGWSGQGRRARRRSARPRSCSRPYPARACRASRSTRRCTTSAPNLRSGSARSRSSTGDGQRATDREPSKFVCVGLSYPRSPVRFEDGDLGAPAPLCKVAEHAARRPWAPVVASGTRTAGTVRPYSRHHRGTGGRPGAMLVCASSGGRFDSSPRTAKPLKQARKRRPRPSEAAPAPYADDGFAPSSLAQSAARGRAGGRPDMNDEMAA